MSGYYVDPSRRFRLLDTAAPVAWRPPQLAALGAALAQWSLAGAEAPIVSVPTGVGKTAIALAAPYLAGSHRVLVVVPSQELRRQTVAQFRSQAVLRSIGALSVDDGGNPVVHEIAGRPKDWGDHVAADVLVGLPASLGVVEGEHPAPRDFFDLVIVDEAHHAPAATWTTLIDHFQARQLLLTATPHRRDRKRIPGRLVYYYPLRQAIDEKLYQPIDPLILEPAAESTREQIDADIADSACAVMSSPEHTTSQLLVRAASKQRADSLAELYGSRGLELPALHSGHGKARQTAIIEALRAGQVRGVVMVGMLIEGFDLPSLRVAAYHDKHKSLEPTAQLLGRLARVHPDVPQTSVLVAARDIDTYPELVGTVRALYEEDKDWATVLPGVIDDVVEEDLKNFEYARSFGHSKGTVDPAQLHPLRRAVLYEVTDSTWKPDYIATGLPNALKVGEVLASQVILYSGVNPDGNTVVVVTGAPNRPRWNAGEALDSMVYELHLVSHRDATRVGNPDLLFLNTSSRTALNQLLDILGDEPPLALADNQKLGAAFDTLERLSVSSVGVRNTYGATRGIPNYKMFAGSSIETGLRDTDTALASLGHAMAQIAGPAGAYTAGLSTGKAKYWETRYTPLRLYDDFISQLADRYWFPTVAPSGRLLPGIARGVVLRAWPNASVLAAVVDYALLGGEWILDDQWSLDDLDLIAGQEAIEAGAPVGSADTLTLALRRAHADGYQTVWTGMAHLDGTVSSTGQELTARRGYGNRTLLADLLTERPPMIYFVDRSTTRGRELHPASALPLRTPDDLLQVVDWPGVDIASETSGKAAQRGLGISIHEWLEGYLAARPRRGTHRWILCNDGPNELADYLVIEPLRDGTIMVELWHAKYAGGDRPSVRTGDFEVVTSQAVKSRRLPTDLDLWVKLARRLQGQEHPLLRIVEGRRLPLEVVLGLHPRWDRLAASRRKPAVIATIGIVQPGLSRTRFSEDLAAESPHAVQVLQMLSSFRDAVLGVATPVVLISP